MTAETVYTIAKALPIKEQIKLYKMLKSQFSISKIKPQKQATNFSEEDALVYLLKKFKIRETIRNER